MSPEFLFTAFIVCLAPGVGVIFTLSTVLGRGLGAGLWAVLGCTLATLVHLGFAMAGLAAVLQTSALLFSAIKYAGVAYLLWMAWGTLQGTGALQVTPDTTRHAPATLVRRGVLLNLLNPKLPMFFVAFLPQFIPAGAPDATALLIELGLGFVAMTAGVFLLYALAAGWLRSRVLGSERAMTWLRRAFAASFAGLGAKLAFERA
ncbi:LysE family translocator [Pararhodobacter marinus]|uniref:LysE family translocator n=1 Tax=Pararhodobacter marinus TaxID=2184063 RepID=A0A2U2C7S4_9RHOB|nr:LysE family translocator [Pararhodobacter marinus]PWE27844.1 LysE family translocator [Pararhodobacter marinus]